MCVFLLLLISNLSWAQSCKPNSIPTAPDSRFEDNADGTITDLRTGLMWTKCAIGLHGAQCASGSPLKIDWYTALQAPNDLNIREGFAGFKDWRLPNIKELDSIVESTCTNPAINEKIFPNTPLDEFWSSTSDFFADAANLDFDIGDINFFTRKDNIRFIRLVRLGQ